ncbi:MAG: ABC transporter substrate-binding protein [Bacteroidota bacterium]
MTEFIIAGVNEHFNYPFKKAIANHVFEKHNFRLLWKDVAGGTGEMIQLLRSRKINFAVLLTEGIISELQKDNHSRLLQFHVLSPLKWGIHVAADSGIKREEEIFSKRFAVSRMGSGSHLMAMVHARKFRYDTSKMDFITVNSLEGGLEALKEKKADVFLWEKFTTEPFLNKYNLARIGEVPTPWPPFVLVAASPTIHDFPAEVKWFCEEMAKMNHQCAASPEITNEISSRYSLSETQTKEWFSETRWNFQAGMKNAFLQVVLDDLKYYGVIFHPKYTAAEIKYDV